MRRAEPYLRRRLPPSMAMAGLAAWFLLLLAAIAVAVPLTTGACRGLLVISRSLAP